jgi:signal peptidase I
MRLRTAVETCVWILLAAMVMETWLVSGIVVPCRVVGGSMAETLCGEHREAVCGDCGHRFACGVEPRCAATQAVCPNCGYAANDLEPLPLLDGERVLVDRTAFVFRRPRRWEIAVLRHPRRADEILVKRIVGLPGETIEICDGDVYVDGAIQRKNLAEQRALAILVHDAAREPTLEPKPPPRWRPASQNSRWTSNGGQFSCTPGRTGEPIDWLVYHHGRRSADGKEIVPSPVTDVSSYNVSRPRREEDVHAVTDLLLAFRLRIVSGGGRFRVQATDGADCFEVRLEGCHQSSQPWRCEVHRGGKPFSGGSWIAMDPESLIEVSLVDRQFLLAIDGRTVFAWPYGWIDHPPSPLATPLAISSEGLGVVVRDLRVYRDVYYAAADETAGRQAKRLRRQLSEDEYFVLGDNSPISEDSRVWTDRGGVASKLLLGKPFAAIPSSAATHGARAIFRVPNLTRTRYIH